MGEDFPALSRLKGSRPRPPAKKKKKNQKKRRRKRKRKGKGEGEGKGKGKRKGKGKGEEEEEEEKEELLPLFFVALDANDKIRKHDFPENLDSMQHFASASAAASRCEQMRATFTCSVSPGSAIDVARRNGLAQIHKAFAG